MVHRPPRGDGPIAMLWSGGHGRTLEDDERAMTDPATDRTLT
jgi:hypothetical protein